MNSDGGGPGTAPVDLTTCTTLHGQAYYQRRTAEGRTKAEIIRCLKRLLAREIWSYLRPLRQARQPLVLAA